MNTRFNLKPLEHLSAPEMKRDFNQSLFSEVAPKYDFITKALSFGRDSAWKRSLVASLPALTTPTSLDLACGTGDITRLLAERYPDGRVIGLDLTPAMLEIAGRHATHAIEYRQGSMDDLPLGSNSIDIVTGGYALRNAPDIDRTLDEIARVLRPGGVAAFLDFSKPPNRAGQQLSHFTLKLWGGFWGIALHGNPDVYGYIADSLATYPDRLELRNRFVEHGFIETRSRRFYAGLLEVICFEKEWKSPHAS